MSRYVVLIDRIPPTLHEGPATYQIAIGPSSLAGGSLTYRRYEDVELLANDLRDQLQYSQAAIERSPCNPNAEGHQFLPDLELDDAAAQYFGWKFDPDPESE
jgi:hypothetical protein